MKQICFEITEEIYDNAIKVLDDVGLTASLAVNLFLSKVVKEQSISWMFEKKQEHGGNDVVNQPTGLEQVRLTKNNAIRKFLNAGIDVKGEVTLASKNIAQPIYWANPPLDVLVKDWSLILNDNIAKKLYLLFLPKNSMSLGQFKTRADRPKLDIQIYYNDSTFTERRSGRSFSRFFVSEIDY